MPQQDSLSTNIQRLFLKTWIFARRQTQPTSTISNSNGHDVYESNHHHHRQGSIEDGDFRLSNGRNSQSMNGSGGAGFGKSTTRRKGHYSHSAIPPSLASSSASTSPTSSFSFSSHNSRGNSYGGRLPRRRIWLCIFIPLGYLILWTWYQLHYNWALNLSYRWRDKRPGSQHRDQRNEMVDSPLSFSAIIPLITNLVTKQSFSSARSNDDDNENESSSASSTFPNPSYDHRPDPLPLAGCFSTSSLKKALDQGHYNWTEEQLGGRKNWISSGLAFTRGMECFDFAGTVQPVEMIEGNPSRTTTTMTNTNTKGTRMTEKRKEWKDKIELDDVFPEEKKDGILIYHTYWRSDLRPFGPRQLSTIRSFLTTQSLERSHLIIWSNNATDLGLTPILRELLNGNGNGNGNRGFGEVISVKQFDLEQMVKGTPLDGHPYLAASIGPSDSTSATRSKNDQKDDDDEDDEDGESDNQKHSLPFSIFDERAWVDGDIVRLLALWNHGGLWFDMDEILVRDLRALAEHEFLSQWDCRDDPNLTLNGAVMRFRKHSPYLCEAFHIMANSPPPGANTLDWGSFLYRELYSRLIGSGIRPFAVIPWCFTDPINCEKEVSIPDPFEEDPDEWRGKPWVRKEGEGLLFGERGEVKLFGREDVRKRVGQVFSIHLHNRWEKDFPVGGWAERLVEEQEEKLWQIDKNGF